ncbi:hypothetical protein D3C78_1413750 [compost metagenome]
MEAVFLAALAAGQCLQPAGLEYVVAQRVEPGAPLGHPASQLRLVNGFALEQRARHDAQVVVQQRGETHEIRYVQHLAGAVGRARQILEPGGADLGAGQLAGQIERQRAGLLRMGLRRLQQRQVQLEAIIGCQGSGDPGRTQQLLLPQ